MRIIETVRVAQGHGGMRWVHWTQALLVLAACHVYQEDALQLAEQRVIVDAGRLQSSFADAAPSHLDAAPEARHVCDRAACLWSVSRDGCESAGLPPSRAPAGLGEQSTANDNEIYLGLTSLRFQSADPASSIGFDVDGACTNDPSCAQQPSVSSCKRSSTDLSDAPGCRDNALSGLLAFTAQQNELTSRYGLDPSMWSCELWRGGYNVITRISGYNGAADDAAVRVDWYISAGLEQPPSWHCPAPNYEQVHAAWSSDAPFQIGASQLTAAAPDATRLPPSTIADAHAYVYHGYLVSRLPDDAVLRFAGDGKPLRGFAMPVRAAVWVGRLSSQSDGRWRMQDGLFAGRVRSSELQRSMRQLGLCDDNADYQQLAAEIERRADVLASGDSDADQSCDALSFGAAFEAAQITPGRRAQLPELVDCCEPGAAQCVARCGDGVLSPSEQCDTAIEAPNDGACPQSCPTSDPCERRRLVGSACDAHCETSRIDTPRSGDGCCPAGASREQDSDCSARCGNGHIEPGETCDPPESCPSCNVADKCLIVSKTGAAASCNVICSVSVIQECRSEDGCCPARCEHGGDSDCSASCGNGRIEPGTTETCEPHSTSACPKSCDDGDACTQDFETGSAANCNVRCSHVLISTRVSGDGCCPSGASHAEDADCG